GRGAIVDRVAVAVVAAAGQAGGRAADVRRAHQEHLIAMAGAIALRGQGGGAVRAGGGAAHRGGRREGARGGGLAGAGGAAGAGADAAVAGAGGARTDGRAADRRAGANEPAEVAGGALIGACAVAADPVDAEAGAALILARARAAIDQQRLAAMIGVAIVA